MTPFSVTTWSRLAVSTALALFALTLTAPSVRAGCGDGAHVLTTKEIASKNTFFGLRGSAEKPAPGPCRGIHCSRREAPLPPVRISTVDEDRWVCVEPLDFSNQSDSTLLSSERTTDLPVRCATSIYHPPR